MVTFSKVFSRQYYSLFFCYVWGESDLRGLQEWLGTTINHLVMLYDGTTDKISVWYDLSEIDKMHEAFTAKITNDDQWFSKVEEAFYRRWETLLPYISQKRALENTGDLKQYYEAWLQWWPPMAILFEIPNVESLPKDIRDRALKAREETQDFSDGGEEIIETFFQKEYPQLVSLWRSMTPEEMFRAQELTNDEVANIRQREQGWAVIDGELITADAITTQLSERGFALQEEKVEDTIREIKGQTACRGYARGKVRVVLTSEDIDKLREGEILVTEMTTPEFVPAMKRAAAIVTDEGGVTCHAAIVSRELNKPCVIGTKIATTALKNDMEVEVHADQGIVKILK